MKTAFLCTCCFLLHFFSFSQTRASQLKSVIASSLPYPQRITAYINYNDSFGTQNFDEWMRLSKEGLALAGSQGDSFSIGVMQRQIGEAYYFKGMYDTAASHFYTSINLLEAQTESAQTAKSYNALAKLYRKIRDLKRALENYDKAFSIFKNKNDSAGMAMIWNESGVVFEYAKDYEKALERYNASLAMDRLLKDDIGIAYALSNIAGVYVLQEKYGLAEQNLMQALAVRRNLRDTFAMALTHTDLAATYLSAASYAKAKQQLDSSNAIAERMGYAELRQNNFDLLSQVAEKTGDYKSALLYQKQKAALRDSIFGIQKAAQIEELNTRYETVKKEQQITDQRNRLQKQNLYLAAGAALVVLLALLGYTQYRRYKWKQEAKLKTEILRQQHEATKAVIRAEEDERQRIAKDLHDGVGQMMSAAKMNLSAFEHEAQFSTAEEKHSLEKIIQLVDESCTEVRSVSHNMMPNALLKNNLEAALREFIQKLNAKKLKVHLYAEGLEQRLDSNVETVLYRVIQECVNNVIKHAGADSLDISIIKDEKEITATIEDNGRGFDAGDKATFDGIGLRNIRTRVEFLKGSVDFDSAPGRGTLVALHVPL